MTDGRADFEKLLRGIATEKISSQMSVSETNKVVEILLGASRGRVVHDLAHNLFTEWLADELEECNK